MSDKKNKVPLLVWLDLETTGLDPEMGHILEMGIRVTTLDLEDVKDPRSWVFPHDREEIIATMDDYVLDMHLSSGLLKEVWSSRSEESRRARHREIWSHAQALLSSCSQIVWRETLDDPQYGSGLDATFHLAGSSIHFDREWLKDHAPSSFFSQFHHRMLDVSAYKLAFPGLLEQPDEPAHRVLADINYSIDQHRQMRNLLKEKQK